MGLVWGTGSMGLAWFGVWVTGSMGLVWGTGSMGLVWFGVWGTGCMGLVWGTGSMRLVWFGVCYGDTSDGLGNTNLTLEYRNNASDFQWVEIADNIPIGGDFSTAVNIPGSGCVVVRLVQEEHGGGNCNCWELTNEALGFDPTR